MTETLLPLLGIFARVTRHHQPCSGGHRQQALTCQVLYQFSVLNCTLLFNMTTSVSFSLICITFEFCSSEIQTYECSWLRASIKVFHRQFYSSTSQCRTWSSCLMGQKTLSTAAAKPHVCKQPSQGVLESFLLFGITLENPSVQCGQKGRESSAELRRICLEPSLSRAVWRGLVSILGAPSHTGPGPHSEQINK